MLSKFDAEGPPVAPSRTHRPAITARPLYISYQAQVERELDQAHLHAASALAQVAISCAAAAFSEFRAANRFGQGEFMDHSDRIIAQQIGRASRRESGVQDGLIGVGGV